MILMEQHAYVPIVRPVPHQLVYLNARHAVPTSAHRVLLHTIMIQMSITALAVLLSALPAPHQPSAIHAYHPSYLSHPTVSVIMRYNNTTIQPLKHAFIHAEPSIPIALPVLVQSHQAHHLQLAVLPVQLAHIY
jgi:hypothetical protein